MAYDTKYGRVTVEHGNIPADEPVFVFRAQDRLTVTLLERYRELCYVEGSPARHLEMIDRSVSAFRDWQEASPDRVRTPDSEASRAWMEDQPAQGA